MPAVEWISYRFRDTNRWGIQFDERCKYNMADSCNLKGRDKPCRDSMPRNDMERDPLLSFDGLCVK